MHVLSATFRKVGFICQIFISIFRKCVRGLFKGYLFVVFSIWGRSFPLCSHESGKVSNQACFLLLVPLFWSMCFVSFNWKIQLCCVTLVVTELKAVSSTALSEAWGFDWIAKLVFQLFTSCNFFTFLLSVLRKKATVLQKLRGPGIRQSLPEKIPCRLQVTRTKAMWNRYVRHPDKLAYISYFIALQNSVEKLRHIVIDFECLELEIRKKSSFEIHHSLKSESLVWVWVSTRMPFDVFPRRETRIYRVEMTLSAATPPSWCTMCIGHFTFTRLSNHGRHS